MRKTGATVFIGIMLLFSHYALASCPRALPTTDPEFCTSFKIAAQCHCTASGLPNSMCSNMALLYKRMIDTFGSLQRACNFQRDTTPEDCINDWNFFRYNCSN